MSVEKYEKDEQIKFRHFVPSRWLHPLAPLMRLSPVDLPSADGFENRPPPASCKKKYDGGTQFEKSCKNSFDRSLLRLDFVIP